MSSAIYSLSMKYVIDKTIVFDGHNALSSQAVLMCIFTLCHQGIIEVSSSIGAVMIQKSNKTIDD